MLKCCKKIIVYLMLLVVVSVGFAQADNMVIAKSVMQNELEKYLKFMILDDHLNMIVQSQFEEQMIVSTANSDLYKITALETKILSIREVQEKLDKEAKEIAIDRAKEMEEETEEEVKKEESSEFDGYVLPNVDDSLNIREDTKEDSKVVGKLYAGDLGKIVEEGKEWTLITSGSVKGYVKNEYLVTGKAAEKVAKEDGDLLATTKQGALRVRKEPTTDAMVYNIVAKGENFKVLEELEDWVKIKYTADLVGYIASDYVDVELQLGEANSTEEELAAKKAAEEAEAAKRAEEEASKVVKVANKATPIKAAASKKVETVVREAIKVTYDDSYLLAGLVHIESGGESYQGKLAVANVVLNRMRSGYGSTISAVIYARGQFPGASNGKLAARLESGPNSGSLKAAKEALSGVNNIGSYCNFIGARVADYDSYSSYKVIGNHCFYKR
jgi:spore germination cell wall hydrolase CwlJ-like protein